ncbi:unnamed protein product [Lactuca saligna]|uniref:Peptidase S8/S53 domain-containing protein n=1 Tax=Lactuca saligna TaxID=75948 RepID=A0AA35YWP3_LACSI|nr:unnamed protein product [Lactuca saligna]
MIATHHNLCFLSDSTIPTSHHNNNSSHESTVLSFLASILKPESDILARLDAAVADGADVMSISIEEENMPLFQDNIAIASFASIQKGIFVSCATGNSGPFNGTVTNIAPWVLTIGASTTDRKIKATKKLGNNKDFDGESLFQPKGSPSSTLLPLLYASSNEQLVNEVKFNEYSFVVVSAGYDRSLRAWDYRSHSTEPIRIIDTFLDNVMSICLTKIEIIAGSVDGIVRTFDIRIDGIVSLYQMMIFFGQLEKDILSSELQLTLLTRLAYENKNQPIILHHCFCIEAFARCKTALCCIRTRGEAANTWKWQWESMESPTRGDCDS